MKPVEARQSDADSQANDAATLRAAVMSGIRWTAATKLVVQVLMWTSTILTVRLLNPEAYGLAAMAGLALGYLMLMSEFGLGAGLVQQRIRDEQTLKSAFGFLMLAGTASFAILFAGAPALASFFAHPEVTALTRIVALNFLVLPFVVIPQALLAMELRYRAMSVVSVVSNLAGSTCMVTLAYFGFGANALVIAGVLTMLTRAVGLNIVEPFLRAPQFSFGRLNRLYRFSGLVLLDRSLWYAQIEFDRLIVGRTLGSGALGLYAVAMQLVTLPMQKVMEIFNTVAVPAYSTIQTEDAKVSAAYLKSVRLVSLLGFPMFWGLGAVADGLILVVLGQKWTGAAPIIQILSVALPALFLAPLSASLLQATGKMKVSVYINVVTLFMLVSLVFAGSHWGLTGVAAGVAACHGIAFLVNATLTSRALNLRLVDILGPLLMPAALAAAMVVVVSGSRHWSQIPQGAAAGVVADVIVGATTYAILLWFLARDRFAEANTFFRGLLGSRGS